MIVSRTSRLPKKKIVLSLADALCTAVAILVAVVLRLGWHEGLNYLQIHHVGILTAWAVFILAFYIGGLYESDRLQRPGKTLTAAVISVALGTVFITAISYATLSLQIGRGIFLGFAAFVFVAVISMRLLYMAA